MREINQYEVEEGQTVEWIARGKRQRGIVVSSYTNWRTLSCECCSEPDGWELTFIDPVTNEECSESFEMYETVQLIKEVK